MPDYSQKSRAELIEELERRDEIARRQHFFDMQVRVAEDPMFADAYEADMLERRDLPQREV